MIEATWTEIGDTYLFSGPPKRSDWGGFLIVNNCQVRRLKQGCKLRRRLTVQTVQASSKDEMEQKIIEIMQAPRVRLLRTGLEANDFATLPIEQQPVSQQVLEGTADIYAWDTATGAEPWQVKSTSAIRRQDLVARRAALASHTPLARTPHLSRAT